ncbi:MAG: hypothetical protein KDD62_10345 [Bdellovibrionales bacterium]|nr:hypothetical protein [Bdellovibrionales bacterium]
MSPCKRDKNKGIETPTLEETDTADLATAESVFDALRSTPGGDCLAQYFGLGLDVPLQSAEEASRADDLMIELREATEQGGDLSDLLGRIADHANESPADADALRALMRSRKKIDPSDG